MDENEKSLDRSGKVVSVWLIDRNNVIKNLGYRIAHNFSMSYYPDDEGKPTDDKRFFQVERDKFATAYNNMHKRTYAGVAIKIQAEKFKNAMESVRFTVLYNGTSYDLVVSKGAWVQDLIEQLAWEVEEQRLASVSDSASEDKEQQCFNAANTAEIDLKINNIFLDSLKEAGRLITAWSSISDFQRISQGKTIEAVNRVSSKWANNARNERALELYDETNKERDWEEAIRLFEAGLKNGEENSYPNFGHMYAMGLGGRPNHRLAAYYFKKGAELNRASNGCHTATSNLGVMYRNGWYVPQSKTIARMKYQRAKVLGSERAEELLKSLKDLPEDLGSITELTIEDLQ